jgi:anti-anti-sigma factor
VTDGTPLDNPPPSTTAGPPDKALGRVETDDCPGMDEEDAVVAYEDQALRILLSEAPLGLRLIGHADLSHRAAIERALRRMERGMSDVLVDLTGLEFIDVGGVRLLIDHAGLLDIDGRSVRVVGARASILRVFQVCLSPGPPNLTIEMGTDKI